MSTLEFFGYAPSLNDIRTAAYTQLDPSSENYANDKANYDRWIDFFNMYQPGDDKTYDPIQFSGYKFDELLPGYKLGRFFVATDISKQVDFVTTHKCFDDPRTPGELQSVMLDFHHQLSNIELRAFSGNPDYNIEIAGVRLGRPFVGGAIFNFCDDSESLSVGNGGHWEIPSNPLRKATDYVYGSYLDSQNKEYIYRMGSFKKNDGSFETIHTQKTDAESIMGLGGNAMVLPTNNGKWKGTGNAWISYTNPNRPDNATVDTWVAGQDYGDMYFSILVRVTRKDNGSIVYPYLNNTTMHTEYILKKVDSQEVIKRVQKGYIPATGEEIYEFGWVCVPVGVKWESGKKYVYILDFTSGVGIQDPEDPDPGTPILGSGITFSYTIEDWKDGNGSDGTDLNVPQDDGDNKE